MRVLGIDPGYARCGWGVVEMERDPKYVAHGCFETSAGTDFEKRIQFIGEECLKVIEQYRPDRLAIETIYFKQSTTTALKVAQVRGVIFYIAAQAGLVIDEMSPLEVKSHLTGYGNADKLQVQQMVKMQLSLRAVPQPDDAADALAVCISAALCNRVVL